MLRFAPFAVMTNIYRPQRSCGQGNIFTPVCHSVHRGSVCLSTCWDTTPPTGADTHLEQTSPWQQTPPGSRHTHPPGADTAPQNRHPSGGDTPLSRPPWSRHPPRADPPEADSDIGSMSGRYASYWNAFLFSH